MSVILSRAYGGFANGASVTLSIDTESALVAQGLAVYAATAGVNPALPPSTNPTGAFVAGTYGPAVLSNIPLGSAALTGYETAGVAQTAFSTNISEIFVPHWNTWTGIGYLNGTGVGTDSAMVWLFNTNGVLVANSAVAGTLNAAGASVMEKVAFTAPITLAPGRYFMGLTVGAQTVTPRHVLAANGAEPRCGIIATGTSFALCLSTYKAAPIAVPTTFTTAYAPIMELYS
jgi:hypothetical protein